MDMKITRTAPGQYFLASDPNWKLTRHKRYNFRGTAHSIWYWDFRGSELQRQSLPDNLDWFLCDDATFDTKREAVEEFKQRLERDPRYRDAGTDEVRVAVKERIEDEVWSELADKYEIEG